KYRAGSIMCSSAGLYIERVNSFCTNLMQASSRILKCRSLTALFAIDTRTIAIRSAYISEIISADWRVSSHKWQRQWVCFSALFSQWPFRQACANSVYPRWTLMWTITTFATFGSLLGRYSNGAASVTHETTSLH